MKGYFTPKVQLSTAIGGISYFQDFEFFVLEYQILSLLRNFKEIIRDDICEEKLHSLNNTGLHLYCKVGYKNYVLRIVPTRVQDSTLPNLSHYPISTDKLKHNKTQTFADKRKKKKWVGERVEKYEYGRIITLLNVKSRCTKNEQMKILEENLNEPTIRDQIYIKI